MDYAKSDPLYLTANFNFGALKKSSDGGVTWGACGSNPTGAGEYGAIAQSTPTSVVYFVNGAVPSYSTDGCATWATAAFTGAPNAASVKVGWSTGVTNKAEVAADPTTAGTYYAFNFGGTNYYTNLVVTVSGSGNGYNIGDTITLSSPSGTQTATIVTVASLTAGAGSGVASVTVSTVGVVVSSPVPTTALTQVASSGGGSAATFTVSWFTPGGFWASTDGGATWIQTNNTAAAEYNGPWYQQGNGNLVAVRSPAAGRLYFTQRAAAMAP